MDSMEHFDLSSAEAREATGGSVHLEFVVTENGNVTHARITRSGGSSIDVATWRVINSMPRFYSGRRNGVPVKVKIRLPIACIKFQ